MGHRCICLTYPYTNTVVYYTWTLQTVGSVTFKKEKKLNGGGILTLNANTIVTGDHLYKRARCVVSCASHMASLTGSGRRGRSPLSKHWDRL